MEPNAVWSLTFVASSLEAGQETVMSFRSRNQMVSTELFSPLLLRSPQKTTKFEKNLSSQFASGFNLQKPALIETAAHKDSFETLR